MPPDHLDVELIRAHYDRVSPYYQFFWGEHIHHGYWENGESPATAQLKLVERLAARARVPRGAHVLDVGCGLGGSALWLARQFSCRVLGVTISPVQQAVASEKARAGGVADLVDFAVMDANRLALPPESFDVVWVIECSEHLVDKGGFLDTCATLLRPGGVLALCAWLVADHLRSATQVRLVDEVACGMLCPSFASMRAYKDWMRAGGLVHVEGEDLTRHVEPTWAYCTTLTQRPVVRALLRVSDARLRRFVAAFDLLRRAYAEGVMAYGMFTARKPS